MTKIPEKYFTYFQQIGTLKTYTKDEIIYLQNDSADFLYLIVKGRVRVYTISSAGHETTLEIIEKGRIFGESSFLSERIRPTTVAAVNSVTLILCNVQNLIPLLCGSPELMTLLFQHLSETCNHLSHQIYRLTSCDRFQQIADFLLEETSAANYDKGITENSIPYTHEEIGGILGLNRVTVSRVLSQFSHQGLIQTNYGKITILDREGLENAAKNSSEL